MLPVLSIRVDSETSLVGAREVVVKYFECMALDGEGVAMAIVVKNSVEDCILVIGLPSRLDTVLA